MTIQPLTDLDFGSAGSGRKPLKICVASFLGSGSTGGVGTATVALIRHLAEAGHKVTVLWTAVHEGKPIFVAEQGGAKNSWAYWARVLEAEGITLEAIPHKDDRREWAHKSWLVKEFIAKHDFDVVYFNDWQGIGYYSLLAKHAGIAPFTSQLHCVIAHATKEWISASNSEYLESPYDIEQMALERKSVEMADVLIGPSRYILQEYQSYGWQLPDRCFYQPLPIPISKPQASKDRPAESTVAIDEIVFFGRLEARKGLWLFCEALDRIADKLRGKVVTFLGPVTFAHGVSTAMQVVERSAKWPFQIRLLTDLDTEQALAYLKSGNRLALMPSLVDNSPCAIYECIGEGIPFVSTLGSGAEELIHPTSRNKVLVEPNVAALAEKLRNCLERGATRAQASFDSKENLATWSKWHGYIAGNKAPLVRPSRASNAPLAGSGMPLFVFVDEGNCDLGPLVENLASHLRRFGKQADYVVLSSRRAALIHLLSHLFSDGTSTPIRFFSPDEREDAKTAILSSSFAFFLDANVEMLTPFFILALEILAGNPSAVVTCVNAVQNDANIRPSIENLPMGDLPGLSVFDRMLGGPVWGLSPKLLAETLQTLELYDGQKDGFVSAAVLGSLFMHRRRMANGPLELIPIVGSITHRRGATALPAPKVEDSRSYCSAMGINPSLAAGGPAWFSIATFNPSSWEVLPETDTAIPRPPSAASPEDDGDDPALLAAAFGRPELAFQLEASAGAEPERLQKLNRVAIEVVRRSSALDLLDLLAKGKAKESGLNGFLTVAWQAADDDKQPDGAVPAEKELASVAVYADSRLRVEGGRIRTRAGLRTGGPAKIVFLDVPLSGQSSFEVNVRSRSSDPIFMRTSVIDQASGQQVGEKSTRLNRSEPSKQSIELYKLHGLVTVAIDFSGVDNMEVFFGNLLAE